jgi:uncharacterized protein YndB with AHSA1/START domain
MTASDGSVIPVKGEFLEVQPPSRLVFMASGFEDKAGNPRIEHRNTVVEEAGAGKTRMTLTPQVMKVRPELLSALSGIEQGLNESLDRLAATLVP